ncbi:MAG: putative RND superfamily exporter protein [Hyphomicrobiaceae bacterium]|jgi:predicted RND superfamily exporter protein
MTWFNRFIVSRPWFVIIAFTLATVAFAAQLPSLRVDFDMEKIFPPDHPEIAYKRWALEYFAIGQPAMVLVVNEGSHGVFTPETLALVAHLSEEVKGVDALDGDDLVSLSEVDNIASDGDMLTVESFFVEPPTTQVEADKIRKAVFANPMMLGTVVSHDGKATIVAADLIPGSNKEEIHAALERIITAAPHGSSVLEIAGRPIVENEMARINNREIMRVMPIVVVTAAVALALALHSVRGVVLTLLVVFGSIVWTLGLMAWTGQFFSALNSPLPMMLVPIGIADGIHVIHHYMHVLARDTDRDHREAVFETMQGMFVAVTMTSLTTAAGLASLATSSMSTNRSFGYFAAFGTLAAMVFSLTLLPATLVVLPRPRRELARFVTMVSEEGVGMSRAIDYLHRLVTERPGRPLMGVLVVIVVALAGFPMLTIDGSVLKNFPADNIVRTADAAMVEHFSASLPLEIIVDGNQIDAWKDPGNLRALDAFQNEIETIDGVGESRSIADYVKRMSAVMNPQDPGADSIPDSRELIAQYLLLYSISGEPDDFDDVVDYDYALANVRAQAGSDHSPLLSHVIQSIDAAGLKHLAPLGLKAHVSGSARETYEFIDLIVTSQIASLSTALLLVWLMASLMLRSVVGGLLTSAPVGIATIATFGGLGWIGEPVGVTTAILGAIAIGIGVDYAVHFVARYRDCCRRGLDSSDAMRETLYSAGIAIFYNAVVVIAGFLSMASSEFLPPRALGLLVAWNMVICFGVTITALAAMLVWFEPKFLRR